MIAALLLSVFTLSQCRISSDSAFKSGAQIDITCHGDTLQFDGRLIIFHQNTIYHQVSGGEASMSDSSELVFSDNGAFCHTPLRVAHFCLGLQATLQLSKVALLFGIRAFMVNQKDHFTPLCNETWCVQIVAGAPVVSRNSRPNFAEFRSQRQRRSNCLGILLWQ